MSSPGTSRKWSRSKADSSQTSDKQEKAWVLKFFGAPPAPLDDVEPQHIRQFMRWRAAEARAAAVAKQQNRKAGAPANEIPITYGQVPEADPDYWLFKRPSNLFAPFDFYRSTAAKATGSLTYKLQVPFFSDVKIFGAVGDQVQIIARDAPGGAILKQSTQDLWEQALGFWELLFSPLGVRSTVELTGIPISPTSELTVTVSAGPASPVELGTLMVGEWRSLTGGTGGTEFGSEAEPRSYSYIKFYDDGTFEIKRRPGATDLTLSAVLDADQAEYTVGLLQQVLDVPVAISATDVPGYGYLSALGLISGRVKPVNSKEAQLAARVKGII